MKAATISTLLFLAYTAAAQGAVNQSCAQGGDSSTYVHIHGRLSEYNGGYPNMRLWNIGTDHLFGIFSGPADLRCTRAYKPECGGTQDTDLPANLEKIDFLRTVVYGDFVLRSLEPFRHEHQQAACIVSADHIVERIN